MIFCRFLYEDEIKFGIVDQHHVKEIVENPFEEYEEVGEPIPFSDIALLAPVTPTKIVGVGINYKEHAKEMKHDIPQEPVLFLKPPTTIIGSQDMIQYPKMSSQVDYEGELAVIIKKKMRSIEVDQVNDFILGYTCFNDVTARDLQKKDFQWSRAKGFDTFSPIGPWIVSDLDPKDIEIESYLNGELKQKGKTSDMIFDVPYLVSYISKIMTLNPGDVITTGTPLGVGPMKPGDMVDVRIEGIGTLRNGVDKE